MLARYHISEEIFDKILFDYASNVLIDEKEFYRYYNGYSENKGISKNKIIYNGEDKMIIREYIPMYYLNAEGATSWKQIVLEKNKESDNTDITSKTSGRYAWNYIKKLLMKAYTDKEIEDILNTYSMSEEDHQIQVHYDFPCEAKDVIYKLTNTFKYDINGAHTYILITMFPKASKYILNSHNRRIKLKKKGKLEEAQKIKDHFNYFVGYLKLINHSNTYYWIVNKVTEILNNAIDKVGGILVYANTDGFIVKDPECDLATSSELGDFKLEFSGDTYVVHHGNYKLYQTGNEKKGSCRKSMRQYADLSEGITVDYKSRFEIIGVDMKTGRRRGIHVPYDPQKIKLETEEL